MRWPQFQYSLNTLVATMVALSVILGIYAAMHAEAQSQSRLVELLVARGGGYYEHAEITKRFGHVFGLTYPADQIRLIKGPERSDWGIVPGWRCQDADLKLLSRFKNLEELYISDATLTDEGLRALLDLQKINLIQFRYCDLSQCDLSILAKLTTLQRLDLYESKVDLETVDWLRVRRTDLEIRGIDPA